VAHEPRAFVRSSYPTAPPVGEKRHCNITPLEDDEEILQQIFSTDSTDPFNPRADDINHES